MFRALNAMSKSATNPAKLRLDLETKIKNMKVSSVITDVLDETLDLGWSEMFAKPEVIHVYASDMKSGDIINIIRIGSFMWYVQYMSFRIKPTIVNYKGVLSLINCTISMFSVTSFDSSDRQTVISAK
jgi:hypothetical protein